MANRSSGGQGPGEKLPPSIAPIPSPETDAELAEQYDESPSLLDEPEIPPACLKDLSAILKDGMSNYPRSAKMAKTAPDNFRYLYADAWADLPADENRSAAAVAAVEKAIEERE